MSHYRVTLAIVLLVPMISLAAVCKPTTSDGEGLQGCLDTVADGDTILLPPGVYRPVMDLTGNPNPLNPRARSFLVTRSITLRGTSDVFLSGNLQQDNNVINDAYHVVLIHQPTTGSALSVRIENLTVTSGNSTDGGFKYGAGILVSGKGSPVALSMSNVTVEENRAMGVGGIYLGHGTEAIIERCVFRNNHALESGGGILGLFASFTMRDSRFIANRAEDSGGGLSLKESFGYLVSDSLFEDNIAYVGGALAAWVSDDNTRYQGTIDNSQFINNRSLEAAGAVLLSEGVHLLSNSVFTDNSSAGSAGAVLIEGELPGAGPGNNDPGHYSVVGNVFTHNTAATGGGALLAISTGSLLLSDNHYISNEAGLWASAVGIGLPQTVLDATGLARTDALGLDLSFEALSHNVLSDRATMGGTVYLARASGTAVHQPDGDQALLVEASPNLKVTASLPSAATSSLDARGKRD